MDAVEQLKYLHSKILQMKCVHLNFRNYKSAFPLGIFSLLSNKFHKKIFCEFYSNDLLNFAYFQNKSPGKT